MSAEHDTPNHLDIPPPHMPPDTKIAELREDFEQERRAPHEIGSSALQGALTEASPESPSVIPERTSADRHTDNEKEKTERMLETRRTIAARLAAINADPDTVAERNKFLSNERSPDGQRIKLWIETLDGFKKDLRAQFAGNQPPEFSLEQKYAHLARGLETHAQPEQEKTIFFKHLHESSLYGEQVLNMVDLYKMNLLSIANTLSAQTGYVGIGREVAVDPNLKVPRGDKQWMTIEEDAKINPRHPQEWIVSDIMPDGAFLVNRILSMNSGETDVVRANINQMQPIR